jgi:hypothetical protein
MRTPRHPDADWLPQQLALLAGIFNELAFGVQHGHVQGWTRRALEHRVRRLLPDVQRLAEDAELDVTMDSQPPKRRRRPKSS